MKNKLILFALLTNHITSSYELELSNLHKNVQTSVLGHTFLSTKKSINAYLSKTVEEVKELTFEDLQTKISTWIKNMLSDIKETDAKKLELEVTTDTVLKIKENPKNSREILENKILIMTALYESQVILENHSLEDLRYEGISDKPSRELLNKKFKNEIAYLVEFFYRVNEKVKLENEFTCVSKHIRAFSINDKCDVNTMKLKIRFITDHIGKKVPFIYDANCKLGVKEIFLGSFIGTPELWIYNGNVIQEPAIHICELRKYTGIHFVYGESEGLDSATFVSQLLYNDSEKKEFSDLMKKLVEKYKDKIIFSGEIKRYGFPDKDTLFTKITKEMVFDTMKLATFQEDSAQKIILGLINYLQTIDNYHEHESILTEHKIQKKSKKNTCSKKKNKKKILSSKHEIKKTLESEQEEKIVEEVDIDNVETIEESENAIIDNQDVRAVSDTEATRDEDQFTREIKSDSESATEEELAIETNEGDEVASDNRRAIHLSKEEKINLISNALLSKVEGKSIFKKDHMLSIISDWLKHTNLYDKVNKVNIKGSHVSFHINNMYVKFALPHGSSSDGASKNVMGKIAKQISRIKQESEKSSNN